MGGRGCHKKAERTDGWEQTELLCAWPEQGRFEAIRPFVLFRDSVGDRTHYRRVSRFEAEGWRASSTRRRLAGAGGCHRRCGGSARTGQGLG